MTAADIITRLEVRFGPAVVSKKLDAVDPFTVVDVNSLA